MHVLGHNSTIIARIEFSLTLMKTSAVCVLIPSMMMSFSGLAGTGLTVLVADGYTKSVLKII